MSVRDQARFRYILDLPAYSASLTHPFWVLFSGSLLFKIDTDIEEWPFITGLQPWKHYVPVRPDLSDLVANIEWANSNPAMARQIASFGYTFACEHLNDAESALEHSYALIWSYAKLVNGAKETGKFRYP